MDSSVKKQSLSLRTRILLTFTTSAFVTLALLGIGIFIFVNRIERDSWLTQQSEASKSTSYQIRTFIDQVQKSQSLISFLQTTMDEDSYRGLLSLMLLIGRNVDEIIVVNEDGNVLFDVARDEPVLISRVTSTDENQSEDNEDENEEDWFEAAENLSQGQFFLGELELDAEGNPYLVISSPNRMGGVIAFRINAQVVSDLIADLKFGETGNAYLVEAEGPIIAHTDFSVVLNRTTLEGRPELIQAEDQDFIGNLLEADDDNLILIGEEYTNFKGEPVLGVRKVISGTDIIIFVEISQTEAFTTSRNAMLILGGFLIFSTLFSMYGFARFSNELVFKPLNSLQLGQEAIEKGDLGHQVAVLRDDEIGQTTAGFNLMSKQLDERNRQRIEQEKRLRALYDVMAQPFNSIDKQLQQALQVGVEFLGMDIGIISQIEGDNYTVLYAYTVDNSLQAGQKFEFKKTYCDLTYQANDLVNIAYMKDSDYYLHPAYAAFGLESYIGVPLVVAGKRFGTLNFSSPNKRTIPFVNEDKEFFVLMGKWVSTVLERYYAEKALRASEANNRLLIENSPSIIIRLDKNKHINFLHFPGAGNTSFEGIVGLPVETFLPDNAYKQSSLENINKVYDNRESLVYETIGINPNTGQAAWYLVNATPIISENDDVQGALLMSIDVTDRRQNEIIIKQRDAILSAVSFGSEKLLKNSNWQGVINEVLAKLGEAAQASRIYIFKNQPPTLTGDILVDQEYEWVSEGITPEIDNPDLQNLSLNEVLPRWKTTLGNGATISGFVKDFPQSERDILEPQNIVSILVLPIFVNDEWWGFIGFDECTGERVWQPLEIEALRTASNNIGATIQRQEAETVVQSQNETLIKANRELAISRRQAEAANKLKSQFLATMSHELRTPLNAVIGYSQLQLAGMVGELSDEQKTFQERILINAQHLLQLINEVLDISKIEAGRMDLSQKPISLRGVFDEIIAQNRVLAENKGLTFTLTYDDRLPETIIGDRGRIKQIVINLISNAVKFTDKGDVKVDVVLHNKDAWRVIVTDTGIGISSHEQETIFDEFRQAENGLERGGTGLGLAIVRKLIAMMGGTIRVNSELGAGSTFTITLPIITEEEINKILTEE